MRNAQVFTVKILHPGAAPSEQPMLLRGTTLYVCGPEIHIAAASHADAARIVLSVWKAPHEFSCTGLRTGDALQVSDGATTVVYVVTPHGLAQGNTR